MRTIFSIFTILGWLIATPASAQDKINIFACEPEWAALASVIGGDKVEAFSATNAKEDPHHVRAKPSLIAAMRKANLVVCSGASLEVGWLPILIQKAGNANTQAGSDGYLLAADFVPMLEKPTHLDRADGDIHPEGNPHVQMNPHNVALVAAELVKRLTALDASNANTYQANYNAFSKRWQEAITRWEKEAASLKGMPVVVHHKSFVYLINWLGMKEVGSLEPKPGVPPTTSHLEELLQTLKGKPAQIIIRTPYEPEDASKWLAEKTGIPAVTLPYTIDGDKESSDLFGLFDHTIALLKEANNAK
jgi:zinc/manganese transport system substrate-binding protein